ncbi:GyrI-like domain-containing protein [Aestuariimicrobium ganziense]|uniref:GyrI-like domain-containing protein n=1 Tax=Aestuariimicrobium ganziense TaxID=2773677 RepID=UPI0019413DFF|nr:GyrI-like domain-containing protein [Aestuariimicrobium ganziense]
MQVRRREVGRQRVLSLTRAVRVGEIDDHIARADALLTTLAPAAGHVFVVYHGEVTRSQANPVEVCLPITDDAVVSLPPGVIERVEPAHAEAYVEVTKGGLDYPAILDAYSAVEQWVLAHGATCIASPREVYFGIFHSSSMDDVVAEVAYPIED